MFEFFFKCIYGILFCLSVFFKYTIVQKSGSVKTTLMVTTDFHFKQNFLLIQKIKPNYFQN